MNKKSIIDDKRIIIEDVVHITKENGKFVGKAIESFLYNLLIELGEKNPDNCKYADNFLIVQELYTYLANCGYLFNPKYLIDSSEVNTGISITYDMSALLSDVDIEAEMLDAFPKYAEQIHNLCHPTENMRCDICGAVTMSRPIIFGDDAENEQKVFCIACYPLYEDIQKYIKSVKESEGTLKAVNKRVDIITEMAKPVITEGETRYSLLKQYRDNVPEVQHYLVDRIKAVLEKEGKTNYDVFSTQDFDIVIWDFNELVKEENFDRCVVTDDTGENVIYLFNRLDVVMTDWDAIGFVEAECEEAIDYE